MEAMFLQCPKGNGHAPPGSSFSIPTLPVSPNPHLRGSCSMLPLPHCLQGT